MNDFSKSLKKLIPVLENYQIEYMIFGGMALASYGCPRQTFDIDIKMILPAGQKGYQNLIEIFRTVSTILPEAPEEFLEKTNVLPVEIENVRFDLVVAELPFEKEAVRKSKRAIIAGVEVNVCTPEDFIIQKAISSREKDWMDIRMVVEQQLEKLDWSYVMKHCRDLSEFMNDSDIMNKLNKFKK